MADRKRRKSEEGGLLIILLIGVAVSMIALSAAFQSWSVTWRRDSEEELIARGNMYVDAILAYRKDHGGQFPTNLEDLAELGPRQVRYIRRLYEDPIAPNGRWGLLYLMPGGQGIYDPGAAERAAAGGGSPFSAMGNPAGSALPPGYTPINQNPAGTGVAPMTGLTPGALPGSGLPGGGLAGGGRPGGGLPGGLPTPPGSGGWGGSDDVDDDAISEQPLGWPIVGVVSRASGWHAENTYKVYKGHSQVNEWQFHVFDRGLQLNEEAQQGATRPAAGGFSGPGFGGKGKVGMHRRTPGMGPGAQPRGRGRNVPAGSQKPGAGDAASPE